MKKGKNDQEKIQHGYILRHCPHPIMRQSDAPRNGNKFDEQTGEWVEAWDKWSKNAKEEQQPKVPATGTNLYGDEQLLCDLETNKSLIVVSIGACRNMRFSIDHLKKLSYFPELLE